MGTYRTFAYNTGATLDGTKQSGKLAGGTPTIGWSASGLQWYMGPDEDPGYIIATDTGSAPTFWRSATKSDSDFLGLFNSLSRRFGTSAVATANDARVWLNSNGYWTNYVAPYTYYRWQITDCKTYPPVGDCVQASEFRFQIDSVDQTSTMGTAIVTNPNGRNPVNEEPRMLNDGIITTKALDLNFVTNGRTTDFIFQFPSPQSFNGYRWATANDEESRDPKSWNIYGSENGTNWTTIHSVEGFTATTTRQAFQTQQNM